MERCCSGRGWVVVEPGGIVRRPRLSGCDQVLEGFGREFKDSCEWQSVSGCRFLELFLGDAFVAEDLEYVVCLGLCGR